VQARDIAGLGDSQLREVASRLCKLQTFLQGGDVSKVIFPPEINASDQGGDGTTPENDGKSPWLPAAATCWQLKAGKRAGAPANLKGEVTKALPSQYLRNGGHYVLVASGYLGGSNGLAARRATLAKEACRAGLPPDKIDARGAEQLADWCNVHPAISRWVLGSAPHATVDEWAGQEEHLIPFQTSPSIEALRRQIQERLDPLAPHFHTHLWGHPGIGKTRLALEASRDAGWKDSVAYFSAPDERARSFIDWIKAQPTRGATVIVDECDAEDVRALNDLAGFASRRIRLLSIGTQQPEPRGGLQILELGPYGEEEIKAILRGWFPHLPPPSIDFAARLSDGYVRYARVIGDALDQDPGVSIGELVGPQNLGRLLDRLLGGLSRQHLHVFAVLKSIGWDGALEAEGQAVAGCLSVPWPEAKATALGARSLGIIKFGRNLCYVSPHPLALALALDAWQIHGKALQGLPSLLPSESAGRAYYERLEEIGGAAPGSEFFRRELDGFVTLGAFADGQASRFWSAVSAFEPRKAAAVLRLALENASKEQRLAFGGEARREVVQTLPRLVWEAVTFEDAMYCLAELAVAENEAWSNNATGEFISHYQVHLGGTVVPFPERLEVLDTLAEREEPAYGALVLRALEKATSRYMSRAVGGERHPAKVVGAEWRPTAEQAHNSLLISLDRIVRLVPRLAEGLQDALRDLVGTLLWSLSHYGYADQLRTICASAVARFPGLKGILRVKVGEHIARGEEAEPAEQIPDVLRELYETLSDPTLEGRIRQVVGPPDWSRPKGSSELETLTREFVNQPRLLEAERGWLTGGGADSAFEFGSELGRLDAEGQLLGAIVAEPRGPDSRLQIGYLLSQARSRGEAWLDRVLEGLVGGGQAALGVAVVLRATPNETRADLLMRSIESPLVAEQELTLVAFSPWREALSASHLRRVIGRLRSTETGKRLAVKILAYWLKARPNELEGVVDVALAVATDLGPLVGFNHEEWLWGQITKLVTRQATRRIVRSIFELQITNNDFFIEHHHPTEEVLSQCVNESPTEVWAVLAQYIDGDRRGRFSIGFPTWLLQRLPTSMILDWIQENPDARAELIAHLVAPDFSGDETLAALLIEQHGQRSGVEAALFGALIHGTAIGPLSSHWSGRAAEMEAVARRTALPRVKRWAGGAAESFRDMEKRHKNEEADEDIRWH